MSVTTDERGTVSYCHRCGYTSSVPADRLQPIRRDPRPVQWSAMADATWRRSRPLAGLASRYLQHRGCRLPPADGDLRYLPGSDRYPPTLCARITDAVTGRPLSLHLTPLAADGMSHGERRMLSGHTVRGGVIRLWPDETVTYGLGIAEGIETALAAAHICTPMWSCIDAGHMAQLPVLDGIDCLAIYADHDAAGLAAAQQCAARWMAAQREVVIYRPSAPGADMVDIARRAA